MSKGSRTLIVMVAISIAITVIINQQGRVAYQSRHIATGLTCGVTGVGGSLLTIENRRQCGGGLLTPVIPAVDIGASYVACMANAAYPDLHIEGADCDSYLLLTPVPLRGPLSSFGRLVRRDAIYAAAP